MTKLMTHIYYGDPNEEFSVKLTKTLINAGVDILEIGIPYTDPVCDGEVFQRACGRALSNGTTPLQVLEGIRKMKKIGINKPIYLTSYYAPIYKIGIKRFVRIAKDTGIEGLIVPDILLEEQEELQRYCKKCGLSLIQFATIYSDRERLKQTCNASSDFIYCISLPGVTGDDQGDRNKLEQLIRNIKTISDKKIYVGFGIKSSEDAREIIGLGADGIIVGSAIARIYEKNIKEPFKVLPKISLFIKSLKESTIEI